MSYEDLGWSAFFDTQHEDKSLTAYRVSEVHRDRIIGLSPNGQDTLVTPNRETRNCAVGDWVLGDPEGRLVQILDRQTTVQRRAAGHDVRPQLIAANVDTLFIVSSCNADFNIARLERFLALAQSSGCYPVVLLTKADQCDDPTIYQQQINALHNAPVVDCLNAKDETEVKAAMNWVRKGQTAAFIGSSGVGKTTLANGMTGNDAATGDIREDDGRGRHTTRARYLKPMLNGGWLIDTPGMRELQLFDARDGLDTVFEDLQALAQTCKFNDCAHESEPGCAVKAALKAGEIDQDRVDRWQKLLAEDQLNTETLAQTRHREKRFSKSVNAAQKSAKHRKGRR